MQRGIVVNADALLMGKTALIKDDEQDVDSVLAQFDDAGMEYEGVKLGYGWHKFHRDAFDILDGEES